MFSEELSKLKEKGLLRFVVSRQSAQGRMIRIGDRNYLNFSSNDYLGLANNPRIAKAAGRALEKFGSGSGASRLLAGGTVLHERLEDAVAGFKASGSALLFNSGYAANTGIIPAIASEGDVIFSDELNHASIIDGCRLSRAKTAVFRHRDMSGLRRLIRTEKARRRLIVTDSVFSMDGDIAPLNELCGISRSGDCLLYIDDAHGTGVLGGGKGALSHFGIAPEPWIIQMGTFSKALGSYGAFVAGHEEVITWIRNSARSLIFSTALPAHVVAASNAALDILKNDRTLLRRLWASRERLAEGLKELGFDISGSETPIIPIKTATVADALAMSRYLHERGICVPAIRPPSVTEPRIRITVSAAHTERDIRTLLGALKGFRGCV